jgi:hypothetical protein
MASMTDEGRSALGLKAARARMVAPTLARRCLGFSVLDTHENGVGSRASF